MNSPNAQRFIVSFLILAALTSSSVFVLSNNLVGQGQSPINPTGARSVSLDGKNVFVENVPVVPSYNSPLASLSDIGTDETITNVFTDRLAVEIFKSNPGGPAFKNGVPNLNIPKDLSSATNLAAMIPSAFSPKMDGSRVSVIKDYTADDIINYLTNSQEAIQGTLMSNLQSVSQLAIATDPISSLSDIYDQTENKIYAVKVPAPLAGFNSAMLAFVDSQRVFFDQNDPAKALVALQNPKLVIDPYKKALEQEADKLKNNLPQIMASLPKEKRSAIARAFDELFGINKAYALVDIIGGPSGIVSAILKALSNVYQAVVNALSNMEWLRKLLTEVLKDQLIHKLMQQVINWVQGGGTPQFVSNWQGFLGDAFNVAAGGVISKYAPQLCSNFGPLLKVSLSPVQTGPSVQSNPYGCTLNQVAGNIDQFRNSFDSGGWLAYGALLQPQNNIYGASVQLNDAVIAAGSKAKEAAQTDASSGGGFKSQKNCVDTVEIGGDEARAQGISSESDARAAFGDAFVSATCSGGTCDVTICNSSNPNAQQNTTPGNLVAAASNEISQSPVGRVVNAQDITALLSAIVNAALNKLVASGKSGLVSLTTAKLNEPGNLNSTCTGLTGSDLTACQQANGSITQGTNSAASTKDGITVKLKNMLKVQGQIVQAGSRVASKAQQAIGYLNIASSTCGTALASSTTQDAQDTLSYIDQSNDELDRRVGDINDEIKSLAGDPNSTSTSPKDDVFKSVSGGSLTLAQAGQMQALNVIINLTGDDKLDELSAFLDIPVLSSSTDAAQRKDDFYNKFGGSVDNPGSTFGKIFGTLDDLGNVLTDIQTFSTTVTVDGGCGILETAKLLYTPAEDTPACSIAAAKKTCRSGNY